MIWCSETLKIFWCCLLQSALFASGLLASFLSTETLISWSSFYLTEKNLWQNFICCAEEAFSKWHKARRFPLNREQEHFCWRQKKEKSSLEEVPGPLMRKMRKERMEESDCANGFVQCFCKTLYFCVWLLHVARINMCKSFILFSVRP